MMRLDQLTLREIQIVEKQAGTAITAMQNETAPKGAMMAALVWVIKKREDPSFTWEQALDTPMDEASAIIGDDDSTDAPDPTNEPLPRG